MLDIQLSTTSARFRTRSSALGVLLLGVLVIAVPFWKDRASPPRLNVAGKILLHEGKSISGIQNAVVGILPTKAYATFSLADGTYSLDVPKGADGESYQALVHVSNTNPPLFVLGVVQFDANGQGKFDHTFTRTK